MPISSPRHRTGRSLHAADGYTLIEMLVAMVAALALAGGLMTFLIVSINQQNQVSSQSFSTRQAETGLAMFSRDIRQAQNNPDAAATLTNDTPVVISYTTGASAAFSASFYIAPAGGCSGTTTCYHVTWSCAAASGAVPGSCTRTCVSPTSGLAAGSCTLAGTDAAVEVTGLASATITPTSSGGATIATATGTPLAPPGTPPSFPVYVTVSLSVDNVSQNLSQNQQTTTIAGSTPVPVQTGVALRAWS